MFKKIIILLIEIGFGVTFNFIGVISLSELILFGTCIFYIKKELFIKYPILIKITWLYLGLIASQIISEIVIGNTFNNSLKGIAVTVVSYLHFVFLFSFFVKDRYLIKYVIIGFIVKFLIFGSSFEGSLSGVLQGGNSAFLKFYLAPLVSQVLLLTSLYLRKKHMKIIFIVLGILFVFFGARSSGAFIMLTGLVGYFVLKNKKRINFKKLLSLVLLLGFITFGGYVFYVNSVLKGEITAGNSEQIKKIDNPYNPINLLMMGRTETFVGAIAFMDKPFFGHGAWATDVSGKYKLLIFKLRDSDFRETDRDLIPAHSVLIGSASANGILAFLFMGYILSMFFIKGIKSIDKNDPFLFIIISYVFSLLWNGLFSPLAHFRFYLPLPFAFLLASYSVNVLKIKYLKNKHNQLNKHYK
jgi:hypothetical protein